MADQPLHTCTCCIDIEKDLHVTPVNIAPDALLDNIYREGSHLVVLADCWHSDAAVKKLSNLLLASKKALPDNKEHPPIFLAERPIEDEPFYQRFVAAKDAEGERKFRDYMQDPGDDNAPPEKYADARKAYFDAALGTFEVTKQRGIRTRFIDATNEEYESKLNWKATQIKTLVANFEVLAATRDYKQDFETTPMPDVAKLSDEEFSKRLKKAAESNEFFFLPERNAEGNIERIRLVPVALQEDETIAEKKADMAKMREQLMQEFKAKPEDVGAEFQKKGNARLTELQREAQQLTNIRDVWRDDKMDVQSAAALQQDVHARGVMRVGNGHLRHYDKTRKEPNLLDRLKARKELKAVRVDMMPIDADVLAKLPNHTKIGDMDCVVCIGGQEGADYTIFVAATRLEPGKAAGYEMKIEKDEPAETGPHKDRIKAPELAPKPKTSQLQVAPMNEEDVLGELKPLEKRVVVAANPFINKAPQI